MRRRWYRLPCAALLLAFAQSATAGALRVMPVRVEVPAGRQFCALTLGNDADRPVTVQVRGFAWTRDDTGVDTLDGTNGPVVNPAIVTIPGGESRLVRCSLPGNALGGETEQQWRLIIDELPVPSSDMASGTVQTLLRLSVPVFRTPDQAQPRLGWSVMTAKDGTRTLRLTNSGTRRAQVIGLKLHLRSGKDAQIGRGFYLLAKSAMAVALDGDLKDEIASVTAETDIGVIFATAENPALPATDHGPALSQLSDR